MTTRAKLGTAAARLDAWSAPRACSVELRQARLWRADDVQMLLRKLIRRLTLVQLDLLRRQSLF